MLLRVKDGERIICLLFIIVCVCFYYLTYSFPKELGATGSAYGSAFFPRFLLGFIILLSAILIGQTTFIKQAPAEKESIPLGRQQLTSSFVLWALCMAFYGIWHSVGYLMSSPLFMFSTGLILGVRKIWILLVLAAVGPFMYLIFENLLKIGL